jgi:hypothetical protein
VGPPRSAILGLARLTRLPAGLPTAQNLHSASRRDKKIQSKAKQSKAKQSKAKQSKAKQSKAKQSKAKQSNSMAQRASVE